MSSPIDESIGASPSIRIFDGINQPISTHVVSQPCMIFSCLKFYEIQIAGQINSGNLLLSLQILTTFELRSCELRSNEYR